MDSSSTASSCCACGIGLMVGNRRAVKNSPLAMNSWRDLMEEIGRDLDVFSGNELWMCKKCFSTYERYAKLKKTITDALAGAMGVVVQDSLGSAPKRPRVDFPPLSQACTSSSPDVAVSFVLLP